MARRPRVFHPAGVREEEACALAPEEAHHVRRVLRLREGDELALFDGTGREWTAVVASTGPDGVRVRPCEEVTEPVESPVETVLLQAVLKPDSMDWAIRKATELGVSRIAPWPAERGEGWPPRPKRLERWRRIALEACKQCGRRRCPPVEPVEAIPPLPADAVGLIADPAAERSLVDAARGRSFLLVVGPHSGLTDEEVRTAADQGYARVSLGPRVLRGETAGLVGLALIQAAAGDLRTH